MIFDFSLVVIEKPGWIERLFGLFFVAARRMGLAAWCMAKRMPDARYQVLAEHVNISRLPSYVSHFEHLNTCALIRNFIS